MSKCATRFELDFHARHAAHNGWSRNRLTTVIREEPHLAQGAAANNFDVTPASERQCPITVGTREFQRTTTARK
ncbi:hypothetical protein [Streptomyces sp. NPDC058595]|uniref:hypothetical protein n=1 Tax=Streptomyces sp. NPDC058595 TaxID=3346550 RepID=UPI00365D1117